MMKVENISEVNDLVNVLQNLDKRLDSLKKEKITVKSNYKEYATEKETNTRSMGSMTPEESDIVKTIARNCLLRKRKELVEQLKEFDVEVSDYE